MEMWEKMVPNALIDALCVSCPLIYSWDIFILSI